MKDFHNINLYKMFCLEKYFVNIVRNVLWRGLHHGWQDKLSYLQTYSEENQVFLPCVFIVEKVEFLSTFIKNVVNQE